MIIHIEQLNALFILSIETANVWIKHCRLQDGVAQIFRRLHSNISIEMRK